MLRNYITYCLIFISLLGFGQDKLLIPTSDSIDLSFKSYGVGLDSIDIVNGFDETLRPGGFQLHEFNLFNNLNSDNNLGNNIAGFNYLSRRKGTPYLYSPLPYLGVQYSFGSKLTQHLNLQYNQQLNKKVGINLRYNRDAGNGFMRRSNYSNDDVNTIIVYKSQNYSNAINLYFAKYEWQENGGFTTDTLLDEFAIEFTPVNKENASTLVEKLDIGLKHYINFTNDSVIKTGLTIQNRLEIINREYNEFNPFLDTVYPITNLDTATTRDQYQTASIKNSGGYYFASKYFEIDALIGHRYWRNQNLGKNRDTNEVFLSSSLYVGKENLSLRNEFYFNLIGASGEFRNISKLNAAISGFNLYGELGIFNLLPTPYQRSNFSNTVNWNIGNGKMQQQFSLKGKASYGKKHNVFAEAKFSTITNGLFFIKDTWRQDTLDVVSIGTFNFGGSLRLNKIHLYPTVSLRINSANYAYQPSFSTRTRFAYNTGVFKAERLKISTGLDIGFDSKYSAMLYNPVLSLYEPIASSNLSGGLMALDVFFAMEIDQFRFFARAQNIDYFWNDSKTRIDQNFTINPFIIKMGVSWDFFN